MATEVKGVVGRLKDLTVCGICADTLTDPRVLPCLHTFCRECIQLAGYDRRPYQRMPCPLCRAEFTIPRQGFVGLQKHFLMENLLEVARLPADPEPPEAEVPRDNISSSLCDACQETGHEEASGSPPTAVVYCVECCQSLCRLCHSHHKRNPSTKNHRFSDDLRVVENLRQEIAGEIDAVAKLITEGSVKLQKLAEERSKFLDKVTKVDEDITKIREEATRTVASRAASLLDELAQSKQSGLAEFQKELDELEGHLAVLEGYKQRCVHAKDSDTDYILCRIAGDLRGTAEDLQQMHESQLKEQIPEPKASFGPEEFDEFLGRRKDHHTTVAKKKKSAVCEPDETLSSSSSSSDQAAESSFTSTGSRSLSQLTMVVFLVSSVALAILVSRFIPTAVRPVAVSHVRRLDEGHAAMGLATFDDKVFVLSRANKSILVYEAQDPFTLLKEIAIPEVTSPWDMAGSADCHCLYVSDERNSCIWKVNLDAVQRDSWFASGVSKHPVTLWLSGVVGPHTLSVSIGGSVLVLSPGSPAGLDRYAAEGVWAETLTLPVEVEDPRHVVESSAGTYIISYGWSGTRTQGVVELDKQGQKIRTYEPMDEFQQLKNPHHLAVDRPDGARGGGDRVFVADFYNNRVLMLDPLFNWNQRVVLTEEKDAILKPYRLCFNQKHRLLVVAHSDGRKVDVYAVQSDKP